MSGLFDRLAMRITGDPPGLASPRVPTRFEPLPEEAGLVEPPSATIAGDVARQADLPGAEGAPATARAPGTSTSPLIPPNGADTMHFQPPAAAYAAAPAGRQAEIAGSPHTAIAATVLPAGQPAAVRRRAADALAMPGSDATPTAIAATSSKTADADGGKEPSTAPTAAPSSTGAPAPMHETERSADVERARPAIEPTRARVPAPAPGRPIAFAPNTLRPQPRVPQLADLASAADASESMSAVPPFAPATGPTQVEAVGVEPASAKRGSQSPKLEARLPASYAASPTPIPPVPAQASAAPIVEVHIGSVEIRAAPQPALPAAAPGPAARSLDDFLAGRRPR